MIIKYLKKTLGPDRFRRLTWAIIIIALAYLAISMRVDLIPPQ